MSVEGTYRKFPLNGPVLQQPAGQDYLGQSLPHPKAHALWFSTYVPETKGTSVTSCLNQICFLLFNVSVRIGLHQIAQK